METISDLMKRSFSVGEVWGKGNTMWPLLADSEWRSEQTILLESLVMEERIEAE